MEERRRERLRRQWISTLASAVALVVALTLMALADGHTLPARPERVIQFGAGPRPDHHGDGNAMFPEEPAAPATVTPVARPQPTVTEPASPPVSAVVVAIRPVTAVRAPDVAPSSTTTTTDATGTSTSTTTSGGVRAASGGAESGSGKHHEHRPHIPHEPHPARHHRPPTISDIPEGELSSTTLPGGAATTTVPESTTISIASTTSTTSSTTTTTSTSTTTTTMLLGGAATTTTTVPKGARCEDHVRVLGGAGVSLHVTHHWHKIHGARAGTERQARAARSKRSTGARSNGGPAITMRCSAPASRYAP